MALAQLTASNFCFCAPFKYDQEPYTVREVRIHLRHIRDLLKSLDLTDGYNGVEGSSPSFLSCVTEECVEGKIPVLE